jgi:E3 ubiquitin-protein ligase UBR7
MDSVTLSAILASQSSLVQEAAEALPHSFSQCTYALGHIRQAVYLCRTCNETRGICAACSIACHTDHEQLELFPKRNFRCDCPTSSLAHVCTLHQHSEEPNLNNVYGQNFKGTFCRCGRDYIAEEELETMIQCLACEVRLALPETALNLESRDRTGFMNHV